MNTKSTFVISTILGLLLFALALVFHKAIAENPAFTVYTLFGLIIGVIVSHDAHNPSIVGMLVADFIFCFLSAFLIVLIYKKHRYVWQWFRARLSKAKDKGNRLKTD